MATTMRVLKTRMDPTARPTPRAQKRHYCMPIITICILKGTRFAIIVAKTGT